VSASGAFSGKLTVAGVSYTLSGAFDDNANYQTVVTRKDAPDLTVALHLVPASEITGAVDDGTTTSEVTADRTTYSASNKTALAGKYTALLSGNAAAPGNGMMLVTISPTGGVAATGRLADGQVVSMGASLNADGAVPYYAGVYKSATGAGSLLGTMLFDSGTNPECSGTYAWFRPSSAGTDYPDGFAESGGVTGAPVPGATGGVGLRGAAATAITAQLSGGGLTADITESGQVTTDGKIVWTTPNPRDLTLSIGATGQVTGSFIDPATGKKRAVLGAWLADQQFGGGFFLGDGSAGALTLSGPPGG
jgi:hypothetical protein